MQEFYSYWIVFGQQTTLKPHEKIDRSSDALRSSPICFHSYLSAAIAKLASTPASGGASVSFSATAPGRATVTVSPEDEISFSIADAAGRSVMSGKLNNYRGSGATALNTLATWSCTQHDSTDTLSGYGTVLVLKNIDPLGSTTQSWTDGAGRTLRSIDQAGNATVMTYDAGGNQLSVRDANNVGADMVYDALGRNTQRTDTAAAVTKTEYDKSGNAIKQTDAKNKHTFISFDSRNRRKSTTYRINAATNFAYTALGQLASLTDAQNQTTSYIYDSRGSKLTETYPDHTPSTSPGQTGYGIVTFTYDNAGRRLTSDVLGNGITESRTYSNDNLLTAINYSNASLGNLTYTWDTNKNKKSESIGGVMSGYGFTNAGTTYDDEDRLTGYQRTNGALSQSWNLTAIGDWNSVTTSGIGFQPVVQNRTHGPTHELLTAGGQTVNTDVKGNITLLPAVLASSLSPQASSLQWDFDNKLKSVDVGNNSSTDVEYKYDALGRRVARVGSSGSFVYVQSDQQTIADYGVGDAPSSPLYRYVYASYIDEPVVRKGAGTGGTIHYYHRNQQYSITAVTTSAGSVAERYAYSAYGEPTILDGSGSVIASSAINNRYSYTGREWDATVGLYHFRARWMSPKTGRFLGRDPIGFIPGFNLQEFMRGRSVVFLDPSGHQAISVTINAFISKAHDKDGDGWLPLFAPLELPILPVPPFFPGANVPFPVNSLLGWYIGGNNRDIGEPGSSKLSKTISIDSCSIGDSVPTDQTATSSGTRFGKLQNGSVVQTDFSNVYPKESDGVGIRPPCKSYWSGAFWGNMPFLGGVAPNIDIAGEVQFFADSDAVTVSVNLDTSGFPDFEILVDGPCTPKFTGVISRFSHPQWGLSYTSWRGHQKISETFQCVANTRKCCKGSCRN